MLSFKKTYGHIIRKERSDFALKLDYNELPYSPPLFEREAEYALNRYPEDENRELIENIARVYRLPASEVAVTHGVDEALDRFIQLFPNHSFVLFAPTFHGFSERLSANDSKVRLCKLSPDFRINPNDIRSLTNNDIVILASPNNPTGHLFADTEIEQLLEASHRVLVDETYIDFSSSHGWLANRPDRMFVYRSFSKSFGLAGLRAGFLVGPQHEMGSLRKKQWFCNMSLPVISAINQSLSSKWRHQAVEDVKKERTRMIEELRRMRFDVLETETNFVIVKDAFGVMNDEFELNDICVKNAVQLGMPGYLRITVDTPENNNFVIKALAPLSLAYPERRDDWQETRISAA